MLDCYPHLTPSPAVLPDRALQCPHPRYSCGAASRVPVTTTLPWHPPRPRVAPTPRANYPPCAVWPRRRTPTPAEAPVAATSLATTTTAIPAWEGTASQTRESRFRGGRSSRLRGVTPRARVRGLLCSRPTPRFWEMTTEDLAHVALVWRAHLVQPPTNPSAVLHAPSISSRPPGPLSSLQAWSPGCVGAPRTLSTFPKCGYTRSSGGL